MAFRWLPPLVALLCVSGAGGHGLMTTPQPRTGVNQAGNNKGNANTGPCGNGNQQTKGAPSANYAAGQQVTVKWNCNIPHGGNCVISMDTTDVAQGQNDDGSYTTDGNGILTQHTLAPSFDCCDDRGEETKTVTIPAEAAAGAGILQWYWKGDAQYYDCADITITAAEGSGGGGAMLASGSPSFDDMSQMGMVGGVFMLILIIGVFIYRMKGFKAEPDTIYESFSSGWPSRSAISLQALLLLLKLVTAGAVCTVPSFHKVKSMLVLAAICGLSALKSIWLLYTTSKSPEKLESKFVWQVLLLSDIFDFCCITCGTFMTCLRKYATWVIDSDRGESAKTQNDIYYLAILCGWLVVAALSWQLVHSLFMVGCCMPGEGLLGSGEHEVELLEKKLTKKKKKSKKKSKSKKKKKKSTDDIDF